LVDEAKQRGGGRIYAGSATNWGADYRVGFVPVFQELLDHDAEGIGFWLRVSSLSTFVETKFDETNPVDYRVLDIGYLILPVDRPPPVPATFHDGRGRHRLWQVGTPAYMQVVDTVEPVAATRRNLGDAMLPFLRSDLPGRNLYPTVALGGRQAATPTATRSAPPPGPAGRVEQESDSPADGLFSAKLVAHRRAVVLLKVSYHGRWKATVDGVGVRPGIIAPVNVGVTVAPGEHTVTFRYAAYPSFAWLLLLGALAVAALHFGPGL